MRNCKNVVFLMLAASVFFCQVSFADPQGKETNTEDTVAVVLDFPPDCYTKEEIDAQLAQVKDAIPVISNHYSNDEIDARLAGIKGAIPDVSKNYTNKEIDSRIAAVKDSIPTAPDIYSKEEINNRIKALNDAITTLEIALSNIRKSIPAELKWPVKTKKILTAIRSGIPADITGTSE